MTSMNPLTSDAFTAASGAANPTWPTGNLGAISGATLPATALTRPGTRVVLRNIVWGNGTTGGFFSFKHGDGTTDYFGGLAFTNATQGLFRGCAITFTDGLAIVTSGITGTGGLLVEFEYLYVGQ